MASTARDSDRIDRRIDDEGGRTDPPDPLRLIVQVTLAIYLTPVVALVCAIGGVSIAIDKAGRWISGRSRGENPDRLHVAQSSWVDPDRAASRRHQRTNVGH